VTFAGHDVMVDEYYATDEKGYLKCIVIQCKLRMHFLFRLLRDEFFLFVFFKVIMIVFFGIDEWNIYVINCRLRAGEHMLIRVMMFLCFRSSCCDRRIAYCAVVLCHTCAFKFCAFSLTLVFFFVVRTAD